MAVVPRTSTKRHPWKSKPRTRSGSSRKNGGTLAPEHIYLDDAISRAKFKKRHGLIALLNAANAKQFDAVIVRDESRLRGDTFRSGLVSQDLLESGIRLFYFYADEEVTLDGAVDKFMIAARSFAAGLGREKTSQRTHEHCPPISRRGFVVGGSVYGYENFEVKEGDRRVRVEYRINEPEAKIVREIFQRYADGDGLRMIAQDLQERGVPAPKSGRRGIGVWPYSSFREMLRRDRYRGAMIWGKQERTYRGGTKVRVPRDKGEWTTLNVPELRIVDDDVWNIVQNKVAQYKETFGAKTRGPTPKYLLTGLGRCSACGGMIHVARTRMSYDLASAYACSKRKNLGAFACENSPRRPVESIDKAILGWFRDNVLTEKMLTATLDQLRQTLTNREQNAGSELPELEAQVLATKTELERLTNALSNNPAETRAFMKELFPKGLTAKRPDQGSDRGVFLEGVATPSKALGVRIGNLASPRGFEPL